MKLFYAAMLTISTSSFACEIKSSTDEFSTIIQSYTVGCSEANLGVNFYKETKLPGYYFFMAAIPLEAGAFGWTAQVMVNGSPVSREASLSDVSLTAGYSYVAVVLTKEDFEGGAVNGLKLKVTGQHDSKIFTVDKKYFIKYNKFISKMKG